MPKRLRACAPKCLLAECLQQASFSTQACRQVKTDLSERFLEFAVSIIKLGKKLNETYEGRHIYGQLFRAGTSAGANYKKSQSAESKKDFQHKL